MKKIVRTHVNGVSDTSRPVRIRHAPAWMKELVYLLKRKRNDIVDIFSFRDFIVHAIIVSLPIAPAGFWPRPEEAL